MELFRPFKNMFENGREQKALPRVTAVVVAAGRSERMGTDASKQFIPLCGIPLLARTLSAFEKSAAVAQVVIVARGEDIVAVADIVREFGFGKVVRIVKGGQTRQQSAAAGFEGVRDAQYVAVHDGARPLATPACINRSIEAAFSCGAAAAAVRLRDTVKQADENGTVIATPDRSLLWAVQTPQVFEAELYRGALEKARHDGADYTDDCQLIEAAGGKVKLVESDYTNIKITSPEDVVIAEAILRARGEAY